MNAKHKAIYDELEFEDSTRKAFDRNLKDDLAKLRKVYKIDDKLGPAAAKLAILQQYRANIPAARKSEERILACHKAREENFDAFHRVFGLNLSKFFHPLTCFDVIAFEAKLFGELPDGVSCRDAILEKYGQRGVDIVTALLGPPVSTTEETANAEVQHQSDS